MARLILDTGVLVRAARGRVPQGAFTTTDDVAVPAIVVAEFLAGTHLDHDSERSAAQRAFLQQMLQLMPVSDYSKDTAEHHAELLAHTRQTGEPRGPHDLIIAATARHTGRTIVTTDEKARFGDLPGVTARVVSA